MPSIYIFSILFAIFFIFFIIELVRRNKLHERYSILWLCFGILLIFLARFHEIIDVIARPLGIFYAPSLLFLIGMIFLIVYTLHITTVISNQGDKIIRLTQELAILKQKYENIKEK